MIACSPVTQLLEKVDLTTWMGGWESASGRLWLCWGYGGVCPLSDCSWLVVVVVVVVVTISVYLYHYPLGYPLGS